MIVSENVCVVVCLLYVCCRRLRLLRAVRDTEREHVRKRERGGRRRQEGAGKEEERKPVEGTEGLGRRGCPLGAAASPKQRAGMFFPRWTV